jgi:hypothetical protein
MGVTLFDQQTHEIIFDTNFWNWRALVEAVRRTEALPVDRLEGLHTPFFGELTEDEARAVATALRAELLPVLQAGERLLLDGEITTVPDDAVFHRAPEDQHKNYSTRRDVLERFIEVCERCGGFRVS